MLHRVINHHKSTTKQQRSLNCYTNIAHRPTRNITRMLYNTTLLKFPTNYGDHSPRIM